MILDLPTPGPIISGGADILIGGVLIGLLVGFVTGYFLGRAKEKGSKINRRWWG
jgi:hypothetical protein